MCTSLKDNTRPVIASMETEKRLLVSLREQVRTTRNTLVLQRNAENESAKTLYSEALKQRTENEENIHVSRQEECGCIEYTTQSEGSLGPCGPVFSRKLWCTRHSRDPEALPTLLPVTATNSEIDKLTQEIASFDRRIVKLQIALEVVKQIE